MTVPNLLTISRILLTPLLVYFLLGGKLEQALAVFFLAGLTDALDGFIARMFNQKSKLGAYLDPLADKLLLVSSFILLAHLKLVPSWLVIMTVSRDVIIVIGLASLFLFSVPVQIRPSAVSKATTALQLLTVLMAMSTPFVQLPDWGYTVLFYCTALFTIVSGIHYINVGVRLYEAHSGGNAGK